MKRILILLLLVSSFASAQPGTKVVINGGSPPGAGGGGISQVGANIYGLIKVNDSTYKVDSFYLTTRLRLYKVVDSMMVFISAKLSTSDTASMLLNYRHWLAGYTKNSDTAAMLANYRHWLQGYLKPADTVAKWMGSIYKRNDSVFYKTGSTEIFSFKDVANTGTSPNWGDIQGTLSNQTDLQAALDLKLNKALTTGQIFIGVSNIATGVAMSGDVTINTSGVTAIGSNKVVDGMLRQSVGTSIIGRAGGTTGNVTDIVFTADGQFLVRRSGALTAGTLVAGDIPTLNQNTTGSAATLTTSRFIHGGAFNGSADVTNIINSQYGGTGNGFTRFTGAASTEKSYTLPNASTTIYTYEYYASLGTGLVKSTTSSGIHSIAVAGTDYIGLGSIVSNGQTMNTARLLGRYSASSGAIQEITVGTGLDLSSGGVLTTTGSVGESNTMSSLGGGLSIYETKVGVDLRINSLVANDFNISSNLIGIDWTNTQAATTSQPGKLTAADWTTFDNKVTSLSVASANGLAGSSSGGKTPVLTLSTSVSGMVKGNGTAFSAATVGTDYSGGTAALATGILKSTTTSGTLSIAVAGTDYQSPLVSGTNIKTINSTSLIGSGDVPVANLALSNLSGVSVNASLIPQSGKDLGATATPWKDLYLYGAGTYGAHSFKFTGTPTANRTFTFPDATTTIVGTDVTQTLLNKTLAASSNTLGGVTMGLGSDATGDMYYRNSSGQLERLGIGTSNKILTVISGLPSWQTAPAATSVANALTIGTELSAVGATTYDGSVPRTLAIQPSSITNTMLAGAIAASKLVGTDINTVGTITTGTWNGGIIPLAYGGTAENNAIGGTANTFWARPNGSTGSASYRAIVAADIPFAQSTLVSGTNIKTVNSNSLVGSGNVQVGDALVANPLSQFASTTSDQLRGIMSNSTGTGSLMFGTTPRITTGISDANGNLMHGFTPISSASSYFNWQNSTSSGEPELQMMGSGSNVSLGLRLKGASQLNFYGNSTNGARMGFYEDTDFGLNVTTIGTGNQSGDVHYTWPLAAPGGDKILKTNSSGQWEWIDIPGGSSGWGLTGNSGTTAGTNFIGTTDGQDVVIKANSVEKFRAVSGGGVESQKITIKTSGEENYTLGHRTVALGFPVVTMKPTGTNKNFAIDYMPTGTPGDYGANPITWADWCNKDVSTGTGSVAVMRVGISSTHGIIQTEGYTESALPMKFMVSTANRIELKTNNTADFNIGKITQSQSLSGDYVGYGLYNTNNTDAESNALLHFGNSFGSNRFAFLRYNNGATSSGHRLPNQLEIASNTGATNGITINALAANAKINFTTTTDGSTHIEKLAIGGTNSTIQVTGSLSLSYVAKTGSYTLTGSDHTVHLTSSDGTFTLPTAVGCAGRVYIIKSTSSGTLTLATTSSQTIDDSAGPIVYETGTIVTTRLQSTGANWITI